MVTVVSAKGGCGKTTVATALLLAGAKAGQRVLGVDLDVNFGLTQVLAVGTAGDTVAEVLQGKVDLGSATVKAKTTGLAGVLDVLPGSRNTDVVLRDLPSGLDALLTQADREGYDMVLLDTPGNRQMYAGPMQSADRIIVPTELDYLAIAGAALTVLEATELELRHRIFGIVVTNARRPLTREARILLEGLQNQGWAFPGVLWRNAGWEAARSGTVAIPPAHVFAVAEEIYQAVVGGWRCRADTLNQFAAIAVQRRMG